MVLITIVPLRAAVYALFALSISVSVNAQTPVGTEKSPVVVATPLNPKPADKSTLPQTNPLTPFEPAKRVDINPKANESDDEKKVRTRSHDRWGHLVKGNTDLAYDYLSPGTRQRSSLEAYKSTIRPGIWLGARVQRVSCDEPELCYVDVTVRVKVVAGRAGIIDQESQVKETWVKSGDNWWFLPKS
jgi:hypothetical protein